MRLFLCAALSAAVLVAVSGCGSDDDSASTGTTAAAPAPAAPAATTATTTEDTSAAVRQAYLATINPICEDYNREVKSLQSDLQAQAEKAAEAKSFKPYVRPLKAAQEAAQRASDRFNRITPPPSETRAATIIAGALKAQARGNALLLQAARTDDGTGFTAATEALKQATPKLQALMREYGMTVCGAAG